MLGYFIHRILIMIPTLLGISVLVFACIELPPGNFLDSIIGTLETGEINQAKLQFIIDTYALDRTPAERYVHWLGGMLQGNFLKCP